MTNEERERAVERLADVEAVLGQGQGGIARDTDYARRVASDLRAILSERAELLAAVERMRGALREIKNLPRLSIGPVDDFDRGARAARLDAADIARAALTTGGEK